MTAKPDNTRRATGSHSASAAPRFAPSAMAGSRSEAYGQQQRAGNAAHRVGRQIVPSGLTAGQDCLVPFVENADQHHRHLPVLI